MFSLRAVKLISFLILFFVVLIVFLPSVANDFVDWDDYAFVTRNSNIQNISLKSVKWMLTTFYLGAWHPLTWFSHSIDFYLWGLNPSPHRLVNILLHCVNVLLFSTICLQLQSAWRDRNPAGEKLSEESRLIAALVAGVLFGVHPLRVESVVWISERKDVLSTLFFLCSIIMYLRFVRFPNSRHNYFMAIVFDLLAVMSKPMTITLPIVMLLLDFFPLYRLSRDSLLKCLVEKVPFIIISVIGAVLNIFATWSSSVPFSYVPPHMRILNACYSILMYIRQSIFPSNLMPIYQLDRSLDYFDLKFLLSFAFLMLVSAVCIWKAFRKKRIWAAVWFYFLFTLAPAAGLFMSYRHAMADRYTYIPTLSLWFLVGLGFARLWATVATFKFALIARVGLVACLILASGGYGIKSRHQSEIWKNTETLWTHVINNADYVPDLAYAAMGKVLEEKGDFKGALAHYELALSLTPANDKYGARLANILIKMGQEERAEDLCKRMIIDYPENPEAYVNYGRVLVRLGRSQEAIPQLQKALELNEKSYSALTLIIAAHIKSNQLEEARRVYQIFKERGGSLPPEMEASLSEISH